MEFKLDYIKDNDSCGDISEFLNVSNIQNYNPIYDLFFKLNETNFNDIRLNEQFKVNNIKKIIVASSAAIYDEPTSSEYKLNEQSQKNPISPYGESKIEMEKEVIQFCFLAAVLFLSPGSHVIVQVLLYNLSKKQLACCLFNR